MLRSINTGQSAWNQQQPPFSSSRGTRFCSRSRRNPINVQIPPLNDAAESAARARQDTLTKPAGSLGRLEDIACKIAGIQGKAIPSVDNKQIVVVAADHGVTASGVSAFPAEVTPQMVANFLAGGAAITVIARSVDANLMVVDAGVASDIPGPTEGLKRISFGKGTADFTQGPAMSREVAEATLQAGVDIATELADGGVNLISAGDMGIGNTTPSAAITAVMTGSDISVVTGRGTGVDDAGLDRKIAAIKKGLETNEVDASDPISVLAAVGGFEIGVIAGLMLGAASKRLVVMVDGFITTAAALIAHGINPTVADYMIAGHRSVEPGHIFTLEKLGLTPILDLDLRLGEGSGAATSLSIVETAVRIHAEMATFEDAAVSNKD